MISAGNNLNHFAENQLTKFSDRDAGDFSDVAREQEMAPKCGSLVPRDVGDLVGLRNKYKSKDQSYVTLIFSIGFRSSIQHGRSQDARSPDI